MQQQSKRALASCACSVRLAGPGDYDKIADLAGQLGYPSTGSQIRIRLDAMANSSQYAVYVVQLPGGQIGGWIGLFVFHSVEQDNCVGISGLIVDQQIRSRGIGKVLLDAAEEWARSQGCTAISVHSNVTRERAHRFYTNNGYRHIKTQNLLHKSL